MTKPFRLAWIAAAAWLAVCAAAGAEEAATAIAAPAERLGETGACRILAPRYEPKARVKAETPVHFQGGARLYRPVAAPCPRAARDTDV